MDHINFNGKLLDAATAVIGADNRGLRYGDGLFETIKYKKPCHLYLFLCL